MKTIKSTTQRGENFVNAYNRSNYHTLGQVYKTYSTAKACAERDCTERMNRENGQGFRILGANCMHFSCGWMTDKGLRIETAYNSYLITF